jgi:uncharacterized protein (DUF4415 family)
MSKPETVRAVLLDGQAYQRMPDGTLVPVADQTDWPKLDAMSEADIEAAALNDADGPPMTDEEWARNEVPSSGQVSVGLKLDSDVVAWFKSQGRGFQASINAVLRRYMEEQAKVR